MSPDLISYFSTTLDDQRLRQLLFDSRPSGLASAVTPWNPIEEPELPPDLLVYAPDEGHAFKFGVIGALRGSGSVGELLEEGGFGGFAALRDGTTNVLVVSGATNDSGTLAAAQVFNDSPMNKKVLKRFSKAVKSTDRSSNFEPVHRPEAR